MADLFGVTGIWREDGSCYFADESGEARSGDMNPPELLAAAVVSCSGRTMQALLERMEFHHEGFSITGVAHISSDAPPRIVAVTLEASIRGARISTEQKERLLELTRKHCTITQTLLHGAEVDLRIDPGAPISDSRG